MRKKLFFILFLFVLTTTISQDNFQLRTVAEIELVTIIPRSSAVRIPIHIDGNLGWEDFKDAGNCTGQGTFSDPYVIENLEINVGSSENGILIENSDVHFRIENVEVTNSTIRTSAGIKLVNVSNGHLINNNLFNNIVAINLVEANNNIISGNTVNNNIDGIRVSYSSYNNSISGNTVNNNDVTGILIASSHNNTIRDNIIKDNTGAGTIFSSSDNNTFSKNTIINNNDLGIWLLRNSENNTISENQINNNAIYGMFIDEFSSWNSIYLNCFNNPTNAFISVNNFLDNGTNGNHWSNYNGTDVDGNGIGDIPYNLTDQEGYVINQDNFPLMECDDSVPTQEGFTIPGYDLFFLIGMISMTVFVLFQKMKKSLNKLQNRSSKIIEENSCK